MKRNGLMERVLKSLGLIAALAILGALLLACGEEETIGETPGQGGNPPIATPTNEPPAPTPTTDPPTATPEPEDPTATPEPADPPIEYPTGSDDLVLRIEHTGGFVMMQHLLTRMPAFSLTGDGCFVHEGPQIMIFPPPALPNLLVTCVDDDGMQAILQAAREAGLLDGDAEYPNDMIADATTTVFTINADGKSYVVSAYALSLDEALTPNMSQEDAEARARLAEFYDKMISMRSWLPEGSIVGEESFYEIDRMQVVVQPVTSPSAPMPDTGIEPAEIAWPLATPLATFGEEYLGNADLRCAVVEGEDLRLMQRVIENANTLTHWTSEDESYFLYLRPLLTGETGCPAELAG
ncbi:MAG TPA: hypothetical protein VMM78_12160 [Thermomicrobiales bacterium]|nr:hypothetical protein [Thermomicrobiales bacterium]